VGEHPARGPRAAPGPDAWTAAEILDHLRVVEGGSARLLARRLERAREAGLGAEADATSRLGCLAAFDIVGNPARYEAPDAVRPAPGARADEPRPGSPATRTALRALVADASGSDLGNVRAQHLRFGDLDMYQWLEFIAQHERRHARQLVQVRDALAGLRGRGLADPATPRRARRPSRPRAPGTVQLRVREPRPQPGRVGPTRSGRWSGATGTGSARCTARAAARGRPRAPGATRDGEHAVHRAVAQAGHAQQLLARGAVDVHRERSGCRSAHASLGSTSGARSGASAAQLVDEKPYWRTSQSASYSRARAARWTARRADPAGAPSTGT
jgi:hypothetical protein